MSTKKNFFCVFKINMIHVVVVSLFYVILTFKGIKKIVAANWIGKKAFQGIKRVKTAPD